MERNSSGALRAPGAFGASGTSDPHATLSSCSLHITHVCSLAAVLRPPAAPAPPAPLPLFSACKSVAVLGQAMRVCSLAAVLRPSAAAPLAARPPAAPAPPAPLSAAFGHTAVLPKPSGFRDLNALARAPQTPCRHTPAGKSYSRPGLSHPPGSKSFPTRF